jgi:hypothetical protein
MGFYAETSYSNTKQILLSDHKVAINVLVSDSGIVANSDGKKIVPAGTIVGGNTQPVLLHRGEPVVKKNTQAVFAKLELDNASPTANSKVTFTAKEAGTIGNSIKVQFLNPGGASKPFEISIVGDTIVVSLATGADSVITSTAAEVANSINEHLLANKLVLAEASGDGSTVVEAHAATALSGGSDGTGYLAEGVLLYDVDVTHGANTGAMLIQGFVNLDRLSEAPCADAVNALKQITFIAEAKEVV